jgi:hypothetical protein
MFPLRSYENTVNYLFGRGSVPSLRHKKIIVTYLVTILQIFLGNFSSDREDSPYTLPFTWTEISL